MIASTLAAIAWSAEMLLSMRLLQGICAAGGFVTVISIVSSALPIHVRGARIRRHRVDDVSRFDAWAAARRFRSRSLRLALDVLIQIPFSAIALGIGWFRISDEWFGAAYGSFDFAGAFIYGVAIFALAYGVAFLPSVAGLASIAFSVAAVAGFLALEMRLKEPLLNVRLFRTHLTFAYSCAAAFLMYAATFSNVVLMSLYLQYLKGMSAQVAGLVMTAQPLAIAIGAPIAGRLSDRFEPRFVASAGIALTGLGLVMLALIGPRTGLAYIVASLVVSGIGFALFAPVNANAVMSSVEPAHYGTASGAHASMRVIGQMISMIIVTLIFALVIGRVQITPGNYAALGQSISLSFGVMALLCIPAGYFSFNRGNIRNRGGDTSSIT